MIGYPPLIAYYRKFELNDIGKFLTFLERKTVIEWVVGYTPSRRITSLNGIIRNIENGDSANQVIKKLNEYLSRKLPREMGGTQPYDQSELALFKIAVNESDFYSEKYSKYLLLRLDLNMVDQESFGGYGGVITIEHILPQNPPPNSEWVRKFSEVDRETLTNAIGNLVLLGRRKNSSARNFSFEDKKNKYFFKGGMTPFHITLEIKKFQEWTPQLLQERRERLINTLLQLYFGVNDNNEGPT